MRQHEPSVSTKRPIAEALRSMLLAGSIASLAIVAAPAALAQDPAAATAETAAGAAAAVETTAPVRKQIHVAISESDPDVRAFNDHVTVLSSPWMEGRLPGTRGMERAMEYMEYWFKQAGLEPAYQPKDGGPKSYRQPFPLGGRREVVEQRVALVGDAAPLEFAADTDFKLSALGRDGNAEGAIAFVGYGIEDGPDGYNSFAEDHSLEGKIALLLRFEPMNADGNSLWSGGDGWSGRAGFAGKISAVAKRKPAAIIVVNTPGANDPRIASLSSGGGRAMAEVPVFMMSTEAASRLVETATGGARTLMALRQHADAPPADAPRSFDLEGAKLSVAARMEEKKIAAENVVGVLPGRGELAKEVIVIGGHLDHLGYGDFGSREGAAGSGKLHPGADDNASGSAGVILLGDMLKKLYEQVPAEQPLRTILFVGFSAEESGLNGSRFYVDNPIYPIKDTVLMMNFDMIGRILNGRLSVEGAGGAKGMQEWADPFFANSGLTVIQGNRRGGGGSDHASFLQAGVPILFAIIADFHEDYHTSRDVLDLIDREASVLAVRLWRDLAFDMAKRPQRFEMESSSGPMRPQPARVRAGLRTRESEDGEGIEVETVTEGGSAAKAGIQAGDRIVKWNKKEMKSRQDFVDDLRTHEPGAVVQAVVIRNGEELTIYVTLQGPREQQ